MKLLLLDAMNLIRRIYAAQEKRSDDPVEQTYLLSQNAILKNVEESSATHVALVFDGSQPTWRHKVYDAYKADRKPMPDALAGGLAAYIQQYRQLGIPCVLYDDLEADDVIATLAVKVAQHGGRVRIVSTDKGFMQIASERISLYHHFEKRVLTVDDVQQQLGLLPSQLPDYLSLVGDSTNHVPGVPGIGPKHAGELLDLYGDLDSILIHSCEIKGRLGESLCEHYRLALFARKMVTLKTDCELGLNLQSLRYQPPCQATSGAG